MLNAVISNTELDQLKEDNMMLISDNEMLIELTEDLKETVRVLASLI